MIDLHHYLQGKMLTLLNTPPYLYLSTEMVPRTIKHVDHGTLLMMPGSVFGERGHGDKITTFPPDMLFSGQLANKQQSRYSLFYFDNAHLTQTIATRFRAMQLISIILVDQRRVTPTSRASSGHSSVCIYE